MTRMKILSKRSVIVAALIALIFILLFLGLSSLFPVGSPENIPIGVFTKDQGDPQIGKDGLGGAVVAWNDTRNKDKDIYAQRLNDRGRTKWKKDGIPVSIGFGEQRSPQVVSFGKETIIAWIDTRNGDLDIYAQRLDANGNRKWEKNGIPVIIMGGDQRDFEILPNHKNLFVVWADTRDGSSSIYGQKIDSKGQPMWGFKGIRLSISQNEQSHPQIFSLSSGEFVVVWEDLGSNLLPQIKAQMITKDGRLKWPHEGVLVATGTRVRVDPRIVSDWQDQTIIVWEERRSDKQKVYAQKMASDGKILWGNEGTALAKSSGHQWHPELVPDGEGGAIVVWKDDRSGNGDVYAQKIDEKGELQWGEAGFPLAAQKNDQAFIKITKISEEWAGVVWKDERKKDDDIYAQIVSVSAQKKKTKAGYPISLGKANQQDPQIVGGKGNKAFIVWSDARRGQDRDVYGAILKF